MRNRMLLGTASLLACAHAGCAGGSEQRVAGSAPERAGGAEGTGAWVSTAGESREREGAPRTTGGHDAVADARDAAVMPTLTRMVAHQDVDAVDSQRAANPLASGGDHASRATDPDDTLDAGVESPPIPLAMFGAIVLQRVKDYGAWRTTFDASLSERKRAGFVAQGVMRGVDDAHTVAVWLAVTDLPQAKAFFADKHQQDHARSALLGRPRVQLSSNVSARMEPGRTGLHAAIVSLYVDDFAPFRMAFDAQDAERGAAGIVGYALSQDVDDSHLAYLYLQGEGPAPLQAYVFAKQTRQQWRDAGVRGNPSVTFVREDELTLCQ